MTNLSGISGKVIDRKGGARYMVNWRSRLFMADKVIHQATITAVFKSGFSLLFHHAVPLGSQMNVEFIVQFQQQAHRLRVKVSVDYCLLRSNGDGADLDLITTSINPEDQHLLNNVLQELSDAKQFNLRK